MYIEVKKKFEGMRGSRQVLKNRANLYLFLNFKEENY